jgi:hypothetical protein
MPNMTTKRVPDFRLEPVDRRVLATSASFPHDADRMSLDSADEFSRDGVHINPAESFNATLKRAHVGVYHYTSPKHLLRYVEEAVFRWNNRNIEHRTLGRLALILGNATARHMPYQELTTQ